VLDTRLSVGRKDPHSTGTYLGRSVGTQLVRRPAYSSVVGSLTNTAIEGMMSEFCGYFATRSYAAR
jgi:hypothetical protein